MRDGTRIRICDMDILHLRATITMLERYAQRAHQSELNACASISFGGEMAQMEQERFLSNSDWEDCLPPIYEDLREELWNREEEEKTGI